MIAGMTKKIGVSLPDELYDWATREVEAGRAESVSALIAHGLGSMRSRALLQEIVDDLRQDHGEPDEEQKAWIAAAREASAEARRRKREGHYGLRL